MIIIHTRHFPFGNYTTINLFGILFTKNKKLSKRTINHERIHTKQMKEMLYIFFYLWSVRDKVANSPRGKELLEKQLNNIRAKKDSIIEEANKELELFKKFQIAAQANPKLTYVDFCNNIKNKEV